MNKRNADEMWEKAILRGKDVKSMLQELLLEFIYLTNKVMQQVH